MLFGNHQRQILFFLGAVLLPCAVLVALSVRMIRQERELAEKRTADDRRRIAASIRRGLLDRLEKAKADETGAAAADALSLAGGRHRDAAVVLVAPIRDGQPVLPWEMPGPREEEQTPLSEPRFAARISEGEQQEFVQRSWTNAAACYADAARIATHPRQAAYAGLLRARVESRCGQREVASDLYGQMLGLSSALTDEQGIPIALYAASGLVRLGTNYEAVLGLVERLLEDTPSRLPTMPYLLRDLLEAVARSGPAVLAVRAREALPVASGQVLFFERALALQKGWAGLGLGNRAGVSPTQAEPVWVLDSDRAWLVSIAGPSGAASVPLAVAVSADKVLPAVEEAVFAGNEGLGRPRISAGWTPGGEALGPNFPGLQVTFATAFSLNAGQKGASPRVFYLWLTLGLVLGVTLFASYLLGRDLRRELRLADLRSQFVASVSHELKTPLTAIRMFAETLRLGRVPDPGTRAEYLETIVNESQRLTRLLNNVLDFSRLEQGRKLYRMEPTCLEEVVQSAARTMQYPLAQQGFDLRVQVPSGLGMIPADADAIEQAVLNLLANAMKYSGEARQIHLRLLAGDRDVLIQVSDHGVGIAPAEQARIFEKFYRAPAAEILRVPGTGLGLTLVRHIARAHGGEVEVESEPGKGSTFTLRIPRNPNQLS